MVEGKQVWNQVKIETAGDILLSKGWSVCFVFKEQVTDYSFASCHGNQTICGALGDANQLADCIDVWTQYQ